MNVSSGATVTVTPNNLTGFATGTYTVMTYGSLANSGTFALSTNTLNGQTLSLVPTTTSMLMRVGTPSTYTWNLGNGVSGNWGASSSWSAGGPPGTADTASFTIPVGGSLNPTLDSNYVAATMNAMVTSGSTGNLVLSSATGPHTLTVTGAMTVGSTTTSFGNVKLQNGASLNVGALTINENNATQISTSYLGDYNATTMSTITVGSGGLTFQGGASSAGASYSIGNGGYTTSRWARATPS